MRILEGHAAVLADSEAELTKQTPIARREAFPLLEALVQTGTFQLVMTNTGRLYAVELHGQHSAAARGQQGLRPSRIQFLRALSDDYDVPVFLGFCDGEAKWWTGWIKELPVAHAITHGDDADPESRRFGWWCRDFPDHGPLVIPDAPPSRYRTPAQEALI